MSAANTDMLSELIEESRSRAKKAVAAIRITDATTIREGKWYAFGTVHPHLKMPKTIFWHAGMSTLPWASEDVDR